MTQGLQGVPMLAEGAGWADKIRYVMALWDSPFRYHLDDDPTDCGFSDDVGAALATNRERLTKDLTPSQWAELWDIYFIDTDERGTI